MTRDCHAGIRGSRGVRLPPATRLITDRLGPAVTEELWQRQRAHVEERVRDGKSNGLIHLPLGTMRANFGWWVATVTATNLTAMLSATVLTVAPQAEVLPDFDADRDPCTEPVPPYGAG